MSHGNIVIVDLILVALFSVPILTMFAWVSRSKAGWTASNWRSVMFLVGLVAVSADAIIYYAWLAYRIIGGSSDLVWKIKDVLADNMTIYLALGALAFAILGKATTRARLCVAASAALQVVLWSNVGI